MLNKTIHTGHMALKDHQAHQRPSMPRSGTLSRKELQKIIEEMLG